MCFLLAASIGARLTVVDQVNPFSLIEQSSMNASAADTNAQAWLALISYSEGTDRGGDPYRVCYAYAHTVQDLSRHCKRRLSCLPNAGIPDNGVFPLKPPELVMCRSMIW